MSNRIPGLYFEIEILGDGLRQVGVSDAKRGLRMAAMKGAGIVKGFWLMAAQRMDIRRSGLYIRGIENAEVTPGKVRESDDSWEIVIEIVNRAPHAAIVEDGHPPFSLVNSINWSNTTGSIKQGDKGPYLHIPFKHHAHAADAKATAGGYTRNTVRTMLPRAIHEIAKSLDYNVPKREGPIKGPQGQHIARDRYAWAGAADKKRVQRNTQPSSPFAVEPFKGGLEHRGQRGVGVNPNTGREMVNPAWKSSKYHGLFKGGPPPVGRSHQHEFMTIRTITPRSQGWNIPAMIGFGVARKVTHTLTHGQAGRDLQALMESTLKHSIGDRQV